MSACVATLEALANPGHHVPDAVTAHAAQCPDCRALLDAEDAWEDPDSSPPPPMGSALAAAVANAAPVRPFNPWLRAMPPVLLTAALTGATLFRQRRPDEETLGPAGMWGPVALFGALAAFSYFSVFSRGSSGTGRGDAWRVGAVVAALMVFCSVTLAVAQPGMMAVGSGAWWQASTHCAAAGSAYLLMVGASALWAARRTALVSPSAAGAAVVVAAGLCGVMVLHVLCAVTEPLHLLAGHGVILLAGALAGAVLGPRLLTP